MINRSIHVLQIFVTFWIILHCSGDKFIDAATNAQTTTGIRVKQSEIDFLLNTIFKYNKYLASLSQSLRDMKTTPTTKTKPNLLKDAPNYDNNNNDVIIDENVLPKYILKRAFAAPLPSALSKNEINKLSYYRNKVLAGKMRRSGKQDSLEEFTPTISVGALANLQGFFEALGQNLESLEEKKLPEDQMKFLERDSGLDHHVRKELLDDSGFSSPMKPTGSAAFLHAIRNYRPQHKIRSLVDYHPEGYYNTNFHDPYYLHAGLGK